MRRKILLILAVAIFSSSMLLAQDDERRQRLLEDKKGITYNTELAGDFKLMTDGWSIGGHYGILKNYYSTTLYTLEFGELKHIRESRQRPDLSVNNFGRSARSFVFGKQNNLFTLRAGVGQKRYFSEKARRKGVAVGMFYNIGPSLGIIKPYYLEIATLEQGSREVNIRPVSYSEETASEFLNINRIYGASSVAMGLDELTLTAGAHAKVALHLDWGAYEENVKALEIGMSMDFYFKNIQLMVTDDNLPYFLNFYAAVQLGKRK